MLSVWQVVDEPVGYVVDHAQALKLQAALRNANLRLSLGLEGRTTSSNLFVQRVSAQFQVGGSILRDDVFIRLSEAFRMFDDENRMGRGGGRVDLPVLASAVVFANRFHDTYFSEASMGFTNDSAIAVWFSQRILAYALCRMRHCVCSCMMHLSRLTLLQVHAFHGQEERRSPG